MKRMNWMIWCAAWALLLSVGVVLGQTNEVVLTDLTVPDSIPPLVTWALGSTAISVGKWMGGITVAVQVLRWALTLFGAKIPAKLMPGVVALVALLSGFLAVGTDGTISGSDWATLFELLAGTIAAFFGYRLLFSSQAKARMS